MPDLSQWRTAITDIADSRIAYRGQNVGALIEDASLEVVLWTLLFGAEPNDMQRGALRGALIAALDHGVTAPSTTAARVVASTRGPLPLSIAAGLIAFAGPAHGGAAEGAGRLFASVVADTDGDLSDRVDRALASVTEGGGRVPGYGHPYHSNDPRVAPLLALGPEDGRHRQVAFAVEEWISQRLGRRLALNADAAVAALLLDVGLEVEDIALVTALGRTFGLAAHAREERRNEKPFRAPSVGSVTWISTLDEEGTGT